MQYNYEQLKQIAKRQHLSYKELANMLGWSESKVKRVFTGRKQLNLVEYNKLLHCLLGEEALEQSKYFNLFTALSQRDRKLIISLMQNMREG